MSDRHIYLKPGTELTESMIKNLIDDDASENARLTKLYEYYCGEQAIKDRVYEDATKPNHRLVNTYCSYITDMATGFFVGIPVQYQTTDEKLKAEINALYTLNDEQSENNQLAEDCSIYGRACEVIYLDNQADINFAAVSPIGKIPIYDTTVAHNLMYLIDYHPYYDIETKTTTTYVDVYDKAWIKHYELTTGGLKKLDEERHQWKDIPIIIYENNKECIGDFERVISLVDAYDAAQSDSVNDSDYFSDAYLKLKGMEATNSDDIAVMKEERVLLLPEDGDADWLLKQSQSQSEEALKTRIAEDIHKFSTIPSMTDKDFASNASGVAMKFKLLGLSNTTAKKERSFKKGLQRRLKLICNMLAVMGTNYDYKSVDIVFTNNIPSNLVEMADVATKLRGLYSDETIRTIVPININEDEEVARIEAEEERGYSIQFDEVDTDDESGILG